MLGDRVNVIEFLDAPAPLGGGPYSKVTSKGVLGSGEPRDVDKEENMKARASESVINEKSVSIIVL